MTRRMDILSPEVRANPYPHYAELRRSSPVCPVDPGGMWAVSRHEDVVSVLKNPALFSSQGFKAAWQPPWVGDNPLAHSLLAQDPPAHTRLRGLVSGAFGPRAFARLEPSVRVLARDLAGGLARREADFVEAFAMPLPAYVIGELLGLDHAQHVHFKRWADDILSVTPISQGPEHEARVRATIAELRGYLTDVLARRRSAPADDVASDLLKTDAAGQSLAADEIVSFMFALLLGGLETTTHFLGNAMVLLADHPEIFALLRADRSLVPAFVEEMMRYDGPSHSLPRFTTADATIAGVTIPAGSLVLALVASANRDERRYPDPDRFDIARGSQGGLQFGHGIHFCIGSALARMEARVALEALIERFSGVERASGGVAYNRTMTVRGPVALPLRFAE